MPPNLTYYAQKDIFIDLDTGSMYSHEDLDFFSDMHQQHKKELPVYSLYQLMEIYPTAGPAAKRGIKAQIRAVKEKIDNLAEVRERKFKNIENISMFDRPLYVKDIEEELSKDLTEYEKEIKKLNFQLAFLNRRGEKTEVIKSGRITEQDVEQARHVPITNFIKVRSDRKTQCIFHSDKTPSMHVYKDNHYYCFSCNESGDVIDIIKKTQGLDFRGAVEYLIGKRP